MNSFISCPDFQRQPQLLVEAAVARARNAAVEGRAHDEMARIFQDDLFGGGLGFAVNMNRIDRVGLDVIPLAPVEDQIRGKENELNFRRQFREQFGDFDVHPPRQRGIGLRLGNAG